jgi:hypothetical protein
MVFFIFKILGRETFSFLGAAKVIQGSNIFQTQKAK